MITPRGHNKELMTLGLQREDALIHATHSTGKLMGWWIFRSIETLQGHSNHQHKRNFKPRLRFQAMGGAC